MYKNHHHNGKTGLAVLKMIRPEIVVVCNGSPPSAGYRKTLNQIGAELFTAGKKGDGNVVLHTKGDGWHYGQMDDTEVV